MDLTKNIRNYLTGQIERTLNHLIASHHLDSLGAYICSPPPLLPRKLQPQPRKQTMIT